jgi:aldehyde:ferredoxin oxidoreductase
MFGVHGRYLRYDLTHARGEFIALPQAVLRTTLGGVGLGAWLLHREAPPGVDPFAPEAPLIFSFSPLVGTPLTTSAKFAVVAKSPLTGFICDALSGSHFAIAAKRMGVDAIVWVGRCAAPSEWIDGRLRDTAWWGASAPETCEALSGEGRVAAIGVAGENRVRFATISNDGRHAGRGGLGAVMGSKNLKAIAVRGEEATALHDPGRVAELARDLSRRSVGPDTAKYRELGTTANLAAFDRLGVLPARNFQQSRFEGAARWSDEVDADARPHTRSSCASCTIGCEHAYAFGAGGTRTRVEYESLFALGSLCGISDPGAVLEAAHRCDELGLDTVSAGGTIAFAMECSERGWLDGPRFGDAESLLSTLSDIALRRGVGELLADGSRRAAWRIGRDSLAFAPQVKGMEIPGFEPRELHALALGFAVGTRGADHNKSGAYEVDFSEHADRRRGDARSARLAIESEDRAALMDSLILCKFLRGVFDDLWSESAEILHAVTGWDFDADELRSGARSIVELRKAFNVREGWKPSDDTLPERFLTEQTGESGARLSRERLDEMIRSYNLARGWSADGYLPAAALEGLVS